MISNNNIFGYEDVVKHIFSQLPRSNVFRNEKDRNVQDVSKSFYKWAFDVSKERVQKDLLSIGFFYHLSSAEKVVEFIVKHDFRKINLTYIPDLTSYHLKLLAEKQKITALVIDCYNIVKWPKMESLQHIYPKNLREIDPIYFSTTFPNLTMIDLDRQKVKGEGLDMLVNLTHMNLAYSGFQDEDLIALATTCLKIQTLNLQLCKVTDIGLTVLLKNCRNIRNLNIQRTKVIGECFEEGVFESVQELNLFDNRMTFIGLSSIGKAFPNLKVLNLANTRTTNQILEKLLISCLELEEVNLSLNYVANKKLTRILKTGLKLRKIDLGCTYVTKEKVRLLRKTFPNLKIRH